MPLDPELARELIVDHSAKPRNRRPMPDADRAVAGVNASCGDRVTLYLRFADRDVIADAAFEGSGCSISLASASMLTVAVRGRTRADALALFERFHEALASGPAADGRAADALEPASLQALLGVRRFPLRVKCATLAWHALRAALSDAPHAAASPVTTE